NAREQTEQLGADGVVLAIQRKGSFDPFSPFCEPTLSVPVSPRGNDQSWRHPVAGCERPFERCAHLVRIGLRRTREAGIGAVARLSIAGALGSLQDEGGVMAAYPLGLRRVEQPLLRK